jgi:hypothetical protein
VGVLKHQTTGRRQSLSSRTLVGRAPACALRLRHRSVSAEHASIFWTGSRWEVRDLGSTNGTWVDGRRLDPGGRAALQEGAELQIGSGAELWILDDPWPPVASARRLDGTEVRVAEGGLLVLPSVDDPRASLFEDPGGRWLVETDGPARPAIDQEEIVVGGTWVLSVPPPAPGGSTTTTVNMKASAWRLDEITLVLEVSRDEEFVNLAIARGGQLTRLPPRVHNHLLLILARARLADRLDPAVRSSEQGWVYTEALIAMLKTDPQRLCVDIFRARQQLASAEVLNAGAIVERRATTRQMRLGTDQFEVRSL